MPELDTTPQQPDIPVSDELEQIGRLLSGEPEKASADPEKELPAEESNPEKVEGSVEPEKDSIDYGMKVPITGGEPVTLGELKDAYQTKQAATLDLVERENRVLLDLEKAQTLLSYIQDLPPHVVEAAKQEAGQDYAKQMSMLQSILPDVKTAEGTRQVQNALHELAAEYGVPWRNVDRITDAITIKMMYDYARLKQSIKAAKDNVKPLRADAPKAGHASKQSETEMLMAKAKQSRNSGDELKAIDALLRRA